MSHETSYQMLREKLSKWPVKLPASPEILEILKMLFSIEEVEFLLSPAFTAPYKDRKTSAQISSETGLPEEQVKRLLNNLAERGVLFRFMHEKNKEIYYSLLPILPGFFEFYLVGEKNQENRDKFSVLIEQYYRSNLMAELGSSNYPWVRVLPSEKNLTVNIVLDTKTEVLAFEKVSEYISASRKIALMNCACRIKSSCKHPLETCMCFDNYADFMVGRGLARYLSIEDALAKLEDFETQGLVHTTTNCQNRPQFICNCCTCSCLVLRGLVEFDNPRCLSRSNFLPSWDSGSCNECELCLEICPTGALRFSQPPQKLIDEGQPDSLCVEDDLCIGCGLCVSNCKTGALALVKIRDELPEGTLRGMWMRSEVERVKE